MKRISCVLFSVFLCLIVLFPALAAEKNTSGSEKQTKMRVKVKGKADMVGKVVQINIPGKTLSIKHGGIVVSFDISNPVLSGYKSIDQIKYGDHVAVSYVANVTRISKATGSHYASVAEEPRPKKGVSAPKKGGPVRVKERTIGREFADVDNNSDGKITPAELSGVMPNLTMEQFKSFDKNSDGSLNKSEYDTIRKNVY